MTTPTERARALRWAGEFIKELAAAGELSEKRKHEALVILRHYPSATEIDLQLSNYLQSRREHSMQLKGIEAVSVVHQIRCDRCDKEALRGEPGFEQMTSIGFDAGYDSIFGDGNRVEIDLCETCLRATLGTWLRVRAPWSIDQMTQAKIAAAVEHPQPTIDSQNPGRFAHLYGVLTTQEMAEHLKCSPEAVYERAVAGELIFLSSPARDDDRRYPAFQLDERLDKSLLKKTIQEYRDADVNSTLLWSFLRTPQKIYAGLTAIEMLLGGMPPQYDTLTPEERSEIFLDVVAEEISRVR